jgi:hypothetical protein
MWSYRRLTQSKCAVQSGDLEAVVKVDEEAAVTRVMTTLQWGGRLNGREQVGACVALGDVIRARI